jgi:predicted secreted protein
MTAVKIPARNLILQVQAADGVTWLPVAGLTSVEVDPNAESAKVDVTSFDSAGSYEGRVMQRGSALTLAGWLIKDDTTGVQDAGQARIDTLGKAVGEASVGTVRFRHPMDTQWKVWSCYVEPGKFGGKTNDESQWGATITRSGATTLTSAP